MKRLLPLLALCALALPASAAWTVETGGSTPVITDGNWHLYLYSNQSRVAYKERTGSSTVLDLRTVKADTGYTITWVDNKGFKGKTDVTKVILPETCTTIWTAAFQGCTGLEEIKVPAGLVSLGQNNTFDGCTNLKYFYADESDREAGRVAVPAGVTTMPPLAFADCKAIVRVDAPAVTKIGNRAFQNCTGLVSAAFSENLSEILSNGTDHSDHAAFYNCTALVDFFPSTWGPMTIEPGTFRNCNVLTNHFDLSASGITEIPSMWAAFTSIAGVTFPTNFAALTGDQNFRELKKGATFRFLGDRPAVTATADKSPFYTKDKNNTSQRHVFVVDAAAYPAWTNGTDFVAMADIDGNNDTKNAFSTSSADFPTPAHPERTLGATIWGSGNGRYNWVVQAGDETPPEDLGFSILIY